MRADQLLVTQGLAPSRSAAQRLIERGAVRWLGPQGWKVPKKAGDELPEGCEIEVTDDAELRWASRGGLKLEGVLRDSGLALGGAVALDVGQSTGGFTDVS
jgi:23S rRNA (cytidine1920-2'-O)/16S rRNA (cytidine1409-2'-O)-methyltransferase